MFHLDEYLGIPATHPASFRKYLLERLINKVGIRHHHLLNGEGDVQKMIAEVSVEIRKAPIDVAFVGVGENGHLAFNEPGSSLTSRTRIKTLTEDTRRANARFFDDDIEQVPRQALTVGIGTIMDAEEVMILVSGASKARALQKVTEEGVNHMWTASALQLHRRGLVVCDDDATLELKVGTVRYFKDLERDNRKPIAIRKKEEP